MQFVQTPIKNNRGQLKPQTIINVLSVLRSLGRVTSYDFALAYWPEKSFKSGSAASLMGRNLLWKLHKQGFVISFSRHKTFSTSVHVFEVSTDGMDFLKNQSGDLCRSLVQSSDAVGQGSNHEFLSSKPKITFEFEQSKQIVSEHQNGLEIIPHILRMGGLRKEAVLKNRDEKESPLSITSGLLSHGGTNS